MDESNLEKLAALVKDFNGIDKTRASLRYRPGTRLVRGYSGVEKETGAISVPIHMSVPYVHPSFDESTGFGYARYGSPTRLELENTIAMLEGGIKAWAFSSGMAAISALVKLFVPGDHIIVSDDLYGGTYRLFTTIYGKYGLEFSYVDTSNLEALKKALRRETRAVFIETPSNPMMHVTDIQAVAELCKSIKALTIVDNTLLSPYFQRPLDFDADIVVHSGTKYLGGHNDIMSGFIVIADKTLIEPFFTFTMSEGAVLSPFDSWLTLRSLKTLALRMEKQQENAAAIAAFLKQHRKIHRIFYTGDPEHPGYEISRRQTTGFGGMISFYLRDKDQVRPFINRLKLILFAESLGGTETLLTYPVLQTHGAIPEALRNAVGVNEKLIRISAGVEDPADLLEDLDQALDF
ncbi:MAG: PLP-dependent aspartate aminotransferase family protein [Spirochaetaceae bacterium]|jgi:cystathionine gamma-synthase|nr:PLP-dependent aspartate aminotransferase family protein [Spirochaetaceae bacterium]